MADADSITSICDVYAQLIEGQITSDTPDVEAVLELTQYVKTHCNQSAFPKGETPDHLRPYLFDEGSEETGTVVRDGKVIPASAARSDRD